MPRRWRLCCRTVLKLLAVEAAGSTLLSTHQNLCQCRNDHLLDRDFEIGRAEKCSECCYTDYHPRCGAPSATLWWYPVEQHDLHCDFALIQFYKLYFGIFSSSSKKRSSLFVNFFHYLFTSINTNSSATGLERPKPTVRFDAAVVKTQHFLFTDDKHPQEITYLMIHWPRGTCKAKPPFPFFLF